MTSATKSVPRTHRQQLKQKPKQKRKAAARNKSANQAGTDAKEVMRVLHEEHRYLQSLHAALEQQTNQLRPGRTPDYHILRDMMRYLAEYPDKYHHPLEDQLFSRLLKRHDGSASDIHELYAQHKDMANETQYLLRELQAICKEDSKPLRNRLRLHLQDYLQFYRQHIELEETQIFPAAKQFLTAADWHAIRQQVNRYSDPLFGKDKIASYANLAAKLSQKIQEVEDEVALAEIFSAYALLESGQAIADGVVELREIIASNLKRGWSESREYLRDTGITGIMLSPLWIGCNSLVNTSVAVGEARELAGEVVAAAKEPFSSRFRQFRRLGSRHKDSGHDPALRHAGD